MGGWWRVNSLHLHGNRDGQHPLAMFVSDLNDNLAGVVFRETISADRSLCRFALRCV